MLCKYFFQISFVLLALKNVIIPSVIRRGKNVKQSMSLFVFRTIYDVGIFPNTQKYAMGFKFLSLKV